MPEPQNVLAPLTDSALFLTFVVRPGGEADVHALLPDVAGMIRSVGFPLPDEELTCVVGIGSDLWDRLFTGPRPARLHPFREITGPRHRAPATPGDLFVHLRARRPFTCFELGRRIAGRLGAAADVVDEVTGFRYYDRRDLLGYVDGTENPTGAAAGAAALVGADDPSFAGGSYLLVQKYVHDLARWTELPGADRDRAIGRHRADDVEIPDDLKAPDAHVALATVEDADGTERKIVRDNMPFGSIAKAEYGTYFAGYAADPGVIETMLTRMVVGVPPGTSDRILDVSTPVTGGLFFAPPADFLAAPPPRPAG
ncbi:putative deferrochelatase/peroxidase YfeX [Actinomadura rubteroloni]|uniref:Putative deferrochelatase/peroxidase YfeX n=1 Tax=Actinomadura rubteroloni TaxID=1926885 RepID=A0A2P4UHS2_9ACTN|nr:Dyp-type peroxidase [Actinomadura rubteroloni]POM24581.1 putative deferrochelatase/peroxidase YfeX [Actinomadura rubteroloni]